MCEPKWRRNPSVGENGKGDEMLVRTETLAHDPPPLSLSFSRMSPLNKKLVTVVSYKLTRILEPHTSRYSWPVAQWGSHDPPKYVQRNEMCRMIRRTFFELFSGLHVLHYADEKVWSWYTSVDRHITEGLPRQIKPRIHARKRSRSNPEPNRRVSSNPLVKRRVCSGLCGLPRRRNRDFAISYSACKGPATQYAIIILTQLQPTHVRYPTAMRQVDLTCSSHVFWQTVIMLKFVHQTSEGDIN